MSTSCLCSQILPKLTEVELLKGKAKKVKTRFYYPHTLRSSKTVSEYDSSGKMTSNIDFYIKKNPQKKYFTYDSIGNIVVCIYKRNDSSQRHVYEYKYDEIGRIKSQMELWDDKFFRSYDSIVYNNDNLPVEYMERHPNSTMHFYFQYLNGNNKENLRYIEEKHDSGHISITKESRQYNDYGFLIKKKRETEDQSPKEPIMDLNTQMRKLADRQLPRNSKHSEEYDYVDYRYDKQGNWTKRKIYLNWQEKGRQIHLKIKRKITYW